jgi:hypothetical protein
VSSKNKGSFIAVNAPTLLTVLWKVIRGWLREDIKQLVHVSVENQVLKQNNTILSLTPWHTCMLVFVVFYIDYKWYKIFGRSCVERPIVGEIWRRHKV